MRLLLKHIRKSVFSSPGESVVLLLTMVLSAIIFCTLGEFYFASVDERKTKREAEFGEADIIVSASDDSLSRFVCEEDLGDQRNIFAGVAGVLSLPSSDDAGSVMAGAVDYNKVNDVFVFEFTSLSDIPGDEADSSVFVSEGFASSRALSLGDKTKLNLLGVEMEYTVRGISRSPLLSEFDVLLNSSGVHRVLCSVSPLFSVFTEDSLPYTRIAVKLPEGMNKQIVTDALAQNANISVKDRDSDDNDYADLLLGVTLFAVLIFTIIIAAVLVCFSLRIISDKRKREYDIFRLSGMDDGRIFLAFVIEIFSYIVVGFGIAILTAYFILPPVFDGITVYTSISLRPRGALVAIVALVIVGAFSVLWHILSSRKKVSKPKKKKMYHHLSELMPMMLLLVALCFTLAALIAKVALRYLFAIGVVASVLAAIFTGVPILLKLLSSFICPRLLKRRGSGASLYLALKNNSGISEMKNLHSILGVVISASITLVFSLNFCLSFISANEEKLVADYVIAGADGILEEELLNTEGVMAVGRAHISATSLPGGKNVAVISVTDKSFISEGESFYPVGNDIYMSERAALRSGLSLGSEVPIEIGGREYTFVLRGFSKPNGIFCYINASDMGIKEDLIVARASGEETYDLLCRDASVFGGFVQDRDSFLSSYTSFARTFTTLLRVYLIFVFALALLGSGNLIFVSYKTRKAHFASLSVAGMTRREIYAMILCELLLLSVFVAALTAFATVVFSFSLDLAMQSFGHALFM